MPLPQRIANKTPAGDPRLAAWRRRRRWLFAGLGAVAGSILAAQFGLIGRAGDDWSRYERRSVRVVRVPDGATLVVQPQGGSELQVRLVGVDAPALAGPAYWSAEAQAALALWVEGREVSLRLEPTRTRADDGSLLAHVYASDTEHLNVELLRAGQVYADRRTPHTMSMHFEQAENEARGKRRGLWAEVTEPQMPAWRQEWLRGLRERNAERRPKATTRPER